MMRSEKGPRERILDKALVLFYLQGIKDTGINQIIKESGVAKASFYDHFQSKENLVLECALKYSKAILDMLESIDENSNGLHEFLDNWISMTRDAAVKKKYYNGCPIANISFAVDLTNKKFQEPLSKEMDNWYNFLSKIYDKAKDNKEINKSADTLNAARRTLLLYEGALTMWKMTGDISYIDDLKELWSELLY